MVESSRAARTRLLLLCGAVAGGLVGGAYLVALVVLPTLVLVRCG